MRSTLLQHTEAITRGRSGGRAARARTAASTSVRVEECPPTVSTAALRSFFSRFGHVEHVGVALDNRRLVLAINQRARLLEAVQFEGIELLRQVRPLCGTSVASHWTFD